MAFDFKTAGKEERRAECKRIAAEIGDDQFFTKKEMDYLPEALSDGEQVLAFTSGLMDGNTWLLTLTQWRIIFLDKGMFYGLKQTDIELDKVYSVTAETKMMFGTIKIQVGSSERKVEQITKKAAVNFANKVRDLIRSRADGSHAASSSAAMPADDEIVSKLERLADLKERGVLTDEEFSAQKARILAT